MAAERRWIILATDGRHVTLGRSAAPSEEEVARGAAGLAAAGLAGWYVIMDGDYWARGAQLVLTPVCGLAGATDGDWPAAAAAFEAARRAAQRRG
jgi:hypothetical protein